MQACPLQWPVGYKKTLQPQRSRFSTTLARARDEIKREVEAIDGSDLIISTNIPVNKDGELRSDYARYNKDLQKQTGVAIYFTRAKQPVSLCCDTYDTVWDNMHAIALSLEKLRAIGRYGVSDFLNRAFNGFGALPAPGETTFNYWQVLGFEGPPADFSLVESNYKKLRYERHPDSRYGSHELFVELQEAYQQAKKYFSL